MRQRPSDLTATQARQQIERASLRVVDWVDDCLERISQLDAELQAWTVIDDDAAKAAARLADANPGSGLLHGVPLGLKDNIDTSDFPTTYGSGIYTNHRPVLDATCASLCKSAGAITLGKTASTEFAYRTPSPCRNPHNLGHSPGGSSSGSAAAVAARMVPLAIGTQTGGSVIRPAAYCGVYGFKPRYGELSFAGVKNLAPSFDTLGLMARSLNDLSLFHAALHRARFSPVESSHIAAPKLAVYRSAFWDEAQPAARACLEQMVDRLADAGAGLHEVRLDELDRRMLEASWVVNKYEASRQFLGDWMTRPDGFSKALHALVTEGLTIDIRDYHAARETFEMARRLMGDALDRFDAVITLPSPGEAPAGLQDTGPVTFNFIWTAVHMAAVNLPIFKGPTGLPIGMQVVSPRWNHQQLLEVSDWIEKRMQD